MNDNKQRTRTRRPQPPRGGTLVVACRLAVEDAYALHRAAEQRRATRNDLLRQLIADYLRGDDERERGET